MKTIHNKRGGFTLMETLVAISILMLAIAGPLTVAQKGLSGAMYAKDQVTAYYLAQDAIEFVRAVRDQNALRGYFDSSSSVDGGAGSHWLAGLADCVDEGGCIVDTTDFGYDYGSFDLSGLVLPCSASCPELEYLPTDNSGDTLGIYGYSSISGGQDWQPSGFVRTVKITREDEWQDGATVTAKVTWTSGRLSNEVVIKDVITKR